MRKNTFTMSLAAMAVAALMGRATATAQTASPYYTGVCEVDPQATSTVVVGNVLSFLEKREFPNKKESLTDEEKQSADLGIGGTYYGDYYTVALNVTEPGAYKIEFDAAHKDQERSLWLYRSATSLPATPQAGDTDEGVEYIEVGEKQMPITGGWTTYEPLTFELDLLEGVNYVKFVFDDRYGGNIGGMRIMRNIPPSPALKTLTVGGVDVLASLDEDGTYTLSLPEGTEQLPEVEAVANELARVEVTQATTDNPVATIKLYDKESGELLATYTIKYELVSQMGGYSFTWDVGDGTTKPLADGSKYKYVRESVSNPAFKIKGVVDIYSDSRYKIKAGQEFALCVPANAVVETVTFVNCSENYYNRPEGSNLDSEWDYIASGNAKVEMEGGMAIGEARDMTATITGHQAGTPITFAVKKCGEVAYSGIRIGYSQLNDHSLNYIGASLDDGATTPVSGSITLYFDRNISYSDSLLVTVDGNTVRSEISGTSLTAYYWELPYATEHTFRLGAGAVRDIFNNKYGEEVKIGFATESEQPVEMAVYDYIVGDTTEFYNALKAINESNTTADAPQKRIFLKNGDYVLREEGTKIDAYNVSLIGQSQEGVLLRSESTQDGQGTAVLQSMKNGVYLQDLTIRTADFRTKQFLEDATSYGRLLTMYNHGEKMIMKRVTLQSNQDTYLTGHRDYHEACTIHGTVDFIYGGGDNFFKNCTIVLENRGGNVITAPGTNPTQRWGMVFDGARITKAEGDRVTNGNWTLGRPWHGEPRTYYLNTIMEVLPSDNGWAGMSELVTHFYEYNSMDADGNPIDLSKRGNSSSSLNEYTPVLTDAQAAEYTVNNVVGGKDGWMPARLAADIDAPTATIADGKLQWNEVSGALCYVVCKDGEFVTATTDASISIEGAAEGSVYTVQAANAMGGLGEAASASVPTGISQTAAECGVAASTYYDAAGRKAEAGSKGLLIRVDTMDDGTTKTTKVVK